MTRLGTSTDSINRDSMHPTKRKRNFQENCKWLSTRISVRVTFPASVFLMVKMSEESRAQELINKLTNKFYGHKLHKRDTRTMEISIQWIFHNCTGFVRSKVIGCFLKTFSINAKKKCKKKWRWPSRKMKIWYKYNSIVVFIFA